MFSKDQKHHIAEQIEKLLLELHHPEMREDTPDFKLTVFGKYPDESWAEIYPNWTYSENNPPSINLYNEKVAEKMKEKL